MLGKGKENGVKSGKSTGSSAAAAASVSANGLGLASSATLSAAQKHNCALVRLVQQLRDGLDRIPNEVAKTFEETSAGRGGDGVIAERGEGGAVDEGYVRVDALNAKREPCAQEGQGGPCAIAAQYPRQGRELVEFAHGGERHEGCGGAIRDRRPVAWLARLLRRSSRRPKQTSSLSTSRSLASRRS